VQSSGVDSQNPGTIYAAANAELFKSIDGGVSWSGANSGLPAGGVLGSIAIDPQTPSKLYGGITGNLGNSGYGQAPGGLNPNRGPGFISEILKSADGGTSWTASGSFPSYVRAVVIDSQRPSNLYAVAGGYSRARMEAKAGGTSECRRIR
jgi:photosystem II stability/assembly factor-like uncharacterized protein